MKRLALIGSKDFAAQIRKFAEDTGDFVVVGYYDDFETKGTIINSLPVLGATNEIEDFYKKDEFDCVFLAAGYNNFNFREAMFNRLSHKVPFANIINPTAKIGVNVTLGEGIYIGPDASIGMNTVIGDNVFLHGGTRLGHDNHIGSHSYFSGRIDTAGFCTIGKRCFVGICVCMADHLSVCDDVWIGLGCIVARSIKKPGKYVSPSIKLIKIE
jgi:sugar O-acyltransferase (sialic acid O-acetyltransferase NeuD family)